MPSVQAAGHSLNYEWIGSEGRDKPVLVFLHEGLGSIGQWRDFPARVAQASAAAPSSTSATDTGNRSIEGKKTEMSASCMTKRWKHFPSCSRIWKFATPSWSAIPTARRSPLIHAGAGNPVRGVVAMAPHVFIEPVCLDSIRKAKQAFEKPICPRSSAVTIAMRAGLSTAGRTSGSIRSFERWDIREDYLLGIRCPVLAIQGRDDEYGTLEQLAAISRRVAGRCELVELPECGHSPFRDQPEAVLSCVSSFIGKIIS